MDVDRPVDVVQVHLTALCGDRERPHLLLGEAAGGERPDDVVLEGHRGGHVAVVGGPVGGHVPHRRVHHVQHHVQVVQHEVQRDAGVHRPVQRRAETLGVDRDNLQVRHDVPEGHDRGVEPLDVADLQHHVLALGLPDQRHRLLVRLDEGLLDQHVHPVVDGLAGHREVCLRGHRNREHVDGRKEVGWLARGRPVFGGDRGRPVGVRVEDTDQFDARERLVDPGVVAPHLADAVDARGDRLVGHSSTTSGERSACARTVSTTVSTSSSVSPGWTGSESTRLAAASAVGTDAVSSS